MKRDFDLIREILLALECCRSDQEPIDALDRVWTEERGNEVAYNLGLLIEAGLVRGEETTPLGEPVMTSFMVGRLTWAGHDFLDAARDEGRWKEAKAAGVKIGGMAFDVLKSLLVSLAQGQLKQLGIAV